MSADDITPRQPTTRSSALSRRTALGLGGAVTLASLVEWSTPALAGTPNTLVSDGATTLRSTCPEQREQSFDQGWRFHRGELQGAEAVTFDDGTWREVRTPHDWRIEDLPDPTASDGGATADPTAWLVPENPPTRIGPFDASATGAGRSESWTVGGEGWYRKHFTLKDLGDVVQIHFDGIYHNSDVWLNGRHLGFYPYGFSPITYDLTPALVRGDNVLVVRVRVESPSARWYPGAGITRGVRLITTRPLHIPVHGIVASSHDVSSRSATVSVVTGVLNGSATPARAQLRVQLLDRRGRIVAKGLTEAFTVAAGATSTPRVDLPLRRPDLWSIEDPNLYTVRAEVISGSTIVDRAEVVTGVRSLSISAASGFLLNGVEVKMRGGNVHHDNGALGAAAHPDAEDRKVRILKESGFNAIRTSHNPPSAALLDACDRYGVVVIDEFFDKWDTTTGSFAGYFDEWWPRVVDDVIARDRNHPSVVIWSTGNEIGRPPATGGQNPSVAKYGKVLAEHTRDLDPTRPVTQGSAMGQAFFFSLPADAPDYTYLDIADVHYQNDLKTTYHNSVLPVHDGHPELPLVVGEAWHEEIYDDWKSVLDHRWAIGTFSWTGWDYLGESGAGVPRLVPVGSPKPEISLPALPYPWISSYQGDHDLIGQRKPQLAWKRVVWGMSDLEVAVERPAPEGFEQRALVWSYYDELPSWTWPGREGKEMVVHIYSGADRVRLQLNGRDVANVVLTEADKRVVTVKVPYAAGTLTAIATKGRREVARTSLATTGAPAGLRLTSDTDVLRGQDDRLAHVLVEVVDTAGHVVPDAVAKVTLALDGPATLAGFGSANPHYVDSYQQPHRFTYHGRALAVLRSTGGRGQVKVAAQVPGLRPASLRL